MLTASNNAMYASALATQRRCITRIYSSFYKGELFPNQLVAAKQRAPASGFRTAMKGGYGSRVAAEAQPEKEPLDAAPRWEDAKSLDVMASTKETSISTEQAQRRPYVPLQDAAEIELKADYFMESGMHTEALIAYGVVTKLYRLAYPENHSQIAGVTIKLGTAFRAAGKLESSRANLESALYMLDQSNQPSLELIAECLFELGLTAEASNDASAGEIYEDAFHIVSSFHSIGESHRMMRLLPRLGRRFVLNHEQKFVYFSPFDYDRTFAIADQALDNAEAYYRKTKNTAAITRVLEARTQLLDKKFFNMKDFAGRIRTMRGHWMRRAHILTNAPTPEELWCYSPTIHQVHRDFRHENIAPLEYENEVVPGVNRVVVDDGDPRRRLRKPSNADIHAYGNFRKANAARRWES